MIIRAIFVALALVALPGRAVEVGAPAPAISLPDLKGETRTLAQLSGDAKPGKVMLIDFWASWCAPCKRSLPWLDTLQKKYGEQGLQIVAINTDKQRADADKFLKQVPLPNLTVLLDPAGASPKAYGVQAMPSSMVIDANGKIAYVHRGFTDASSAEIEKIVIDTLAARKK
jgi:cytochrome c biogenesis protein CcmG, thiol:disulfide interchange protein DsbE